MDDETPHAPTGPPDPVCQRCGHVHDRCTAHRKHDGQPCRAQPIRGMDKCRKHVGMKLDDAKAEGKRRLVLADLDGQVAALLTEAGVADTSDPTAGLMEAVTRTRGMMRLWGAIVGSLQAGRSNSDAEGLFGPDHLGDDRAHIAEQRYRDWTDLHAKAVKLAIDAGIAERQVRIAEDQAAVFVALYEAALEEVASRHGFTPDQDDRTSMARHLRALPGGTG